jgi:hypothetical protein
MTRPPDRDELEQLLPWYAAGTLAPAEKTRVEAALAADPGLARSLALVSDELGETVRLNESLGAPSPHAYERLLARMDEAPRPARRGSLGSRLAAWLAETLPPRLLAWAAVAAALVIAVQGGLIGYLAVVGGGTEYRTASGPAPSPAQGPGILVRFADDATAAQIAAVLARHGAVVVDGPRAGLFRLGFEPPRTSAELPRIAAELAGEAAVVRFAAPAPAGAP